MIDNAAANHPQVGGAIPGQRTGEDARFDWSNWSDDATMVLPMYQPETAAGAGAEAVSEAVAATTPADAVRAASHARAAAQAQAIAAGTAAPVARDTGDRLPSSERNMLIFVAMLLALGTIAVVATMGVGRFG